MPNFCLQLLDCFTISVVLVLSWLFLRTRYLLIHIIGVAICLAGIGCLIAADGALGKGINGGMLVKNSRFAENSICK